MLGDHLARTALDDLTRIHHHRGVGEVTGRRDVVGDVKDREIELLFQVLQKVQYPDTDGDVEHRHRLIGEQHLRRRSERSRDCHALALATAQLVGKLVEVALGRCEIDLAKQPGQKLSALGFRRLRMMDADRTPEHVAHRVDRVERGERILQDHLYVAHVPTEPSAEMGRNGSAVETDDTGGCRQQLSEQPGNALQRGRVAGHGDVAVGGAQPVQVAGRLVS